MMTMNHDMLSAQAELPVMPSPPHAAGGVSRLPGFGLRDPGFRAMALTCLVSLIEEFNEERLDEMAAAGITPELYERVRRLDLLQILRLARDPQLKLHLLADGRSLAAALTRVQDRRAHQLNVEYFIQRGASRRMLRALFKLTDRQIRQHCQTLGKARRAGRTRLPTWEERCAIVTLWRRLCEELADDRARYLQLHAQYAQYSLAALEHVVREAEQLARPHSRSAKRTHPASGIAGQAAATGTGARR
jgi:Protein of unknown function (DUF2857)